MKIKQKLEKGKKENTLRGPKVAKTMKSGGGAKFKIAGISKMPKQILKAKKVKQVAKDMETAGFGIPSKTIDDAVKIVTALYEEHKKKSKTLLLNDNDFINLQINWMRVPEVPEQRRKYVKLLHGIHGDNPEVCLFVANRIPKDKKSVKRTPDEKIEYSVDFYQELLKTNKVEGISCIIPLFQLKTEYDSYELKRKLVDRFDLFLVQSTLLDNSAFFKHLGIAFTKKNKVPLSLKFPKDLKVPDNKFAERVSELTRTTWYTLKGHGDTVSLRVGNVSQSYEQLKENLTYVLNQLTGPDASADAIPGGVANIKSIMLKSSRSPVVPLYINLAPRNSVPVPVLKSNRPLFETVEDELSTLPGKRVTVLPSGDVFVTDDPNEKVLPGWEDDEDDWDADDDEEEKETPAPKQDENTKKQKKAKSAVKAAEKKGKGKAKAEKDADLSEDSDAEAESAEQQYLTKWNEEADEEELEEAKKAKKEALEEAKKAKKEGKAGKKAKKEAKVGKKQTEEPKLKKEGKAAKKTTKEPMVGKKQKVEPKAKKEKVAKEKKVIEKKSTAETKTVKPAKRKLEKESSPPKKSKKTKK